MAIKLDKSQFEKIDACFVDILDKKEVSKNLTEIEKVLSNVFGKTFHVNVMKPKRNAPFYIMSIFPEESTLDKLVASILNEEPDKELKSIWDENKIWTIEIDNRILTGSFIDANSKELTALLLHECGHVIYSNSIPQRMSRVMKYQYAKASLGTKNVMKNGIFKKVLQIPILKACIFENYKTNANLKKEVKADIFAVKMGYGDELDSVLNKIITSSSLNKPTASHINQSSQDVYQAMRSDTDFSISLIEDLKKREAKVSKANFQKMLLDLPSEYTEKILGKLETSLFKGDTLKPGMAMTESLMDVIEVLNEDAYLTEAFSILKKKMKRIDPAIVDYVMVLKDDIKSNDDKLMLVSYIYSKIDLIDYYLAIMDNPKYERKYIFANSKNELIRIRSQLEKLRELILNYRIPETKYSIQVVYPDGYYG